MRTLFALVAEVTGRVRIGTTKILVEERLLQLQRECPDDLAVLGASAEHAPLERRVHAALARHRRRGDWYEREVGDAIRAAGALGAWVDALLGPRALTALCVGCGEAAAPGALTCGARRCVRVAKGRRTPAGLLVAPAGADVSAVRAG